MQVHVVSKQAPLKQNKNKTKNTCAGLPPLQKPQITKCPLKLESQCINLVQSLHTKGAFFFCFLIPCARERMEKVGSGKATRVFQPALANMPSDIDREYCLSRYVGHAALKRMNALAISCSALAGSMGSLARVGRCPRGPPTRANSLEAQMNDVLASSPVHQ